MIGASDAGAHLDMIAAFRYSTGFLEEAVRQHELLSLERAVHLLTGAPARLYGLRDRGVLREGSRADIVVFDEDMVGSKPVGTRFDLPGGAGRLYAEAVGIDHVIVDGVEVAAGGPYTGERSGAAAPGARLRHANARVEAVRTRTRSLHRSVSCWASVHVALRRRETLGSGTTR